MSELELTKQLEQVTRELDEANKALELTKQLEQVTRELDEANKALDATRKRAERVEAKADDLLRIIAQDRQRYELAFDTLASLAIQGVSAQLEHVRSITLESLSMRVGIIRKGIGES